MSKDTLLAAINAVIDAKLAVTAANTRFEAACLNEREADVELQMSLQNVHVRSQELSRLIEEAAQ